MTEDRLIRLKEILKIIPVHRSTVYVWIAKGQFPKPIKIGRASFWRWSDLQKVIEGNKEVRDVKDGRDN